MTEIQVRKLLFLIQNIYNGFDGTNDEKVILWHDLLKDVPFEAAQILLRRHIKTEKFPPTIADLRPTENTIPNATETRIMLEQRNQEWKRLEGGRRAIQSGS